MILTWQEIGNIISQWQTEKEMGGKVTEKGMRWAAVSVKYAGGRVKCKCRTIILVVRYHSRTALRWHTER